MPRIAAFVCLLALVLARPAAAQERQDERLVPGARLRITETVDVWRRTQGDFVGVRGDTLLVSRADEPEVSVPLARVTSIEVLTRPSRRGAYALMGIGIGAAAGFIVHRTILDARYSNDEWNGFVAALIGAPVGAVAGGVAGAVIGAPRWETVRVRPQGVRVGLRINLP